MAKTRRCTKLAITWTTGLSLLFAAGCKSAPPVTDDSLNQAVQAALGGDQAIAGLPLQSTVSAGVVTLSGSVANDAQRTIAARDAASIPGVREVINNIASPSAGPAASSPPPATPAPVTVKPAPAPRVARQAPRPSPAPRTPAPIERQPQTSTPVTAASIPPVVVPSRPPAPASFSVTIPSGTALPVRITQTLDSATTQTGDTFSGVLSNDVVVDGHIALPSGSRVSGHVDAVQEAAHFKGSSLLTVSLASVSRRSDRGLPITTEPYTVEGTGRGKNTAVKTGGGAAVGALLGGIFGGGKGAAIGAAAGGGLGAGSNAITRGQQVQIPSESVVRFRLAAPLTLQVRTGDSAAPQDPTLERRTPPSN